MKKFLLLIAMFAGSVSAQTLTADQSANAFGRFMSVTLGGGKQNVSFGTNGTPLAGASSASLSTSGGSTVNVTQSGSIRLPPGTNVPVTGVSPIPASKFVPVLKKALLLAPLLGTGIALYDLGKELGFTFTKTNGELTVKKYTAEIEWNVYGHLGSDPLAVLNSIPSLANAYAPDVTYKRCFGFYEYVPGNWAGNCQITNQANFSGGNTFAVYGAKKAEVLAPVPMSEFLDSVAEKSGWPATSAISNAIADALPLTGSQIEPGPLAVTGPTTVDGPTSETSTPTPEGTKKTTKKTQYTCAYDNSAFSDGTQVVCTEQTTTTEKTELKDPVTGAPVLDPVTGEPVTTPETVTSTEKKPVTESPQTDCEKNPSSAMCREFGQLPEGETLSKKDVAVSVVAQAFAPGGACPSPLPFSVAGRSYSVSYQPLCDRLYILRVLFIALGGFLAAFILADSFKV